MCQERISKTLRGRVRRWNGRGLAAPSALFWWWMYRAKQFSGNETGFVGALADLVGVIIETAAGTPQKEERAAKAAAAQAASELEAMKLQAELKAGTAGQLVPGVPNWLLALGGAGVAWYLLK